jgi:hypothetical protein
MPFALTPLRWFVILALLAAILALGLPPDPHAVQQLHTTSTIYRLAIAALLVPYVLIWYASFYAFAKLVEYSTPLKGTEDGKGFQKITTGMGVLAFALVVPTIISLILNNIASHDPVFKPAAVVITNYLTLFPALIAFLLLYNGSRVLTRTTKEGPHKMDLRWHAPWFLMICVLFSHLTIENQYQTHPYHMRLLLLVATFIVPYLYAWALGLLAAYELRLYAKTVQGSLYQRAIKQFAAGIMVAVIGSIAIQFVTITLTERFRESVGLILIALGTKKLKLLEEV